MNTHMDWRGFASAEAMHAYILERWNSRIRPGDEEGNARTWMLYGHVHNTKDEALVNEFINRTRQILHRSVHDAEALTIPCQMINCFCMFSDDTPLTPDEWIEVDGRRRKVMNLGINRQEDK